MAGTRPEALKLVSLVRALRGADAASAPHAACAEDAPSPPPAALDGILVSSGQHARMVADTFAPFGIAPDDTLPAPPAGSSLSHAVRALRENIRAAIVRHRPDAVVVQGDTSSAYAGALAAAAERVPVAHVEAGLRTAHPLRPFPEEVFRRRIAPIAAVHYAPTAHAAANLGAEGVPADRIVVAGNPIVDTLRHALESGAAAEPPWPAERRAAPWLVLTLHRRENYGRGLEAVCDAVLALLAREPSLNVMCPVHPNPTIGGRMRRRLADHPRIVLTAPQPYAAFVRALAHARLVLTDSGGIQEEAPYLGVPVIVARENTERPEALALGTTRLVPVEAEALIAAAHELLVAPRPRPAAFDASGPFGDGRTGERIATHLASIIDGTSWPKNSTGASDP